MTKALLVIDMQNAFFDIEPLKSQRQPLVEAVNSLVASARTEGMPVIFFRTIHQPDRSTWTLNMKDDDQGFLYPNDAGSSYLEGLNTTDSHEILKTRDSAFWGTDLADYLRTKAVDTVVLAGVSTHQCIFQTAVDAYSANFRVELAIKAIGTSQPDIHDTFIDLMQSEYRIKLIDDLKTKKSA